MLDIAFLAHPYKDELRKAQSGRFIGKNKPDPGPVSRPAKLGSKVLITGKDGQDKFSRHLNIYIIRIIKNSYSL